MTFQQELAKQNKKLDQLEMALESLHNTSKAVGDSLEEQITCGLERGCDCRLIEQLEENTDRAHEATRTLRRDLRSHIEHDGIFRRRYIACFIP